MIEMLKYLLGWRPRKRLSQREIIARHRERIALGRPVRRRNGKVGA